VSRRAKVRAAMAAGLQAVFTGRGLAITVYAKPPKRLAGLTLPIAVIRNTVHQYGPTFAGNIMGNADTSGTLYPNAYRIDVIYNVYEANQDQTSFDADTDALDDVVEAIEDYFLSKAGQYNPDVSAGGNGSATTEAIVLIQTEFDDEGDAHTYKRQEVWGAITTVHTVEPGIAINQT
jgi:hypothetical protein